MIPLLNQIQFLHFGIESLNPFYINQDTPCHALSKHDMGWGGGGPDSKSPTRIAGGRGETQNLI